MVSPFSRKITYMYPVHKGRSLKNKRGKRWKPACDAQTNKRREGSPDQEAVLYMFPLWSSEELLDWLGGTLYLCLYKVQAVQPLR